MRFPRLRLLAAGTLLGVGLVAVGANPAGSPLPSRAQQRDATAVVATAAAQPAPVAAPLPGPQRRVEATPQGISDAAMRVRVEQVLARPDLALPGPVGVSVVNPDGETVVSAGGDLPLLPASTEKLLTAAAALEILGLDFRYTTTLAASAAPDSDGIVAGDLVLSGGGDPALSTPVFATLVDPQRPRTPLEALADQVVAAGVRQVTGSVLGDPSVFPDEPAAPGWPDTYFHNGHATRVSGLTIDTGRVYTVGARGVTATTADDPAAQAAAALYQLLRERGVVFGGTAGSTRAPPEASDPLGTVESPPMEDLLRHTVQHSDNHLADAIFRSVGVETGDGSWAGSARAAATALEPLSMPSNGVTLADGSGLSRNNRVSAAALTAVQAAITSSRFGERWQGLMAVSGESGTLRERLRGTVAEHRFRGKTGSLHDVRALAGSVVGPDGEHYHLAVVANGLPAAAVPVARALQDAVVVAVAEVLYGCLDAPPAGLANAQGQVAAPACTP